jgi:hypothetical protein
MRSALFRNQEIPMKTIACFFLVLFAVVLALAQQSAPTANGPQVLVLAGLTSDSSATHGFIYHEVMRGGEFVRGAPYTGMAVTDTTQVLADGNRIVNHSTAQLARDSEGRTRREETVSNFGPLTTEASRLVFITDPVARAEYVLNLEDHTASVRKLEGTKIITVEQKRDGQAAGKPIQSSSPTETHLDALGVDAIEGLQCDHMMLYEMIPAGSIGNERPIVIKSETWASPDLHLLVIRDKKDPRFGQTMYKVTHIVRGNPDPSLFEVPKDFKVLGSGSALQTAR